MIGERQVCAEAKQPGGATGRPIRSRPSWGEAMAATGCVLSIVAASALPWARAHATWRGFLLRTDIELGTLTFRLTDNPWLAAALIAVAALCLAGLLLTAALGPAASPWRRYGSLITIAASLLLFCGSAVYITCLIKDAYDFLGIYGRLLELARSIPLLGPMVESTLRENLSVSAVPHSGVYVFVASAALIMGGGILMRRRCPPARACRRRAVQDDA